MTSKQTGSPDVFVCSLAPILFPGITESQQCNRGMEYQHHPIYTHRPDMCLYSSDSHSYQKRHRTATDRMVCIRHHIYNQRILAEKPWFQLQGPSFFIFNGRCPNPYHLVGHPLFLLLYRCGKLRRTLRYGNRRFHH